MPQSGGSGIRKGPWLAEEDEVLLAYVREHGPRDWSSIRSKGLLPRTGKSCRLRWVNKLKPDLKSGCKFSAEEERVVIDLQASFGNKWARIATFLPGRTDNDVKNFWSTRQKRLARLLRPPHLPVPSPSNPPAPISPYFQPNLACSPPCIDLIPFTEECSSSQFSNAPCVDKRLDSPKAVQMVNLDAAPLPQPPLDHHLLGLPLLLESQDLNPEIEGLAFPEQFGCVEGIPQLFQQPMASTFFDVGTNSLKLENPDNFFDDFPAEMFDGLDQPPGT